MMTNDEKQKKIMKNDDKRWKTDGKLSKKYEIRHE